MSSEITINIPSTNSAKLTQQVVGERLNIAATTNRIKIVSKIMKPLISDEVVFEFGLLVHYITLIYSME